MASTDGYLRDPNPTLISKLSIVDQLSDEELETFRALRNGQAQTALPLSAAQQMRLALRWDNATDIDRLSDPVRQGMAAVFGEARMIALLGNLP